ncbi:hypothetical protein GGS23DRAFT_592701 [Durotheca rogersii]|uniref:uncharacterized protein n=1 Tax=Durotheca rogersii TaxID=419775 RepID=UPI00222037E8|nr:uncharacterized protein GGS23DRAFT_592701 [Durotheca rogersii]KAI5867383.1 hypothetical protein GGS23DRAFT_592701 [Durotheca rogersii]
MLFATLPYGDIYASVVKRRARERGSGDDLEAVANGRSWRRSQRLVFETLGMSAGFVISGNMVYWVLAGLSLSAHRPLE